MQETNERFNFFFLKIRQKQSLSRGPSPALDHAAPAYHVQEHDQTIWIWFGSTDQQEPASEPPAYDIHTKPLDDQSRIVQKSHC
ncbi:hypothetical protein [Pseudomonas sp. 65/3-MNA-CIBAN-0223]|uniref:hypothetical protein n=1 Tax=Pseudomonas sp. 65/3-MNA-CIBAN-0223 TaxID=3140476 RepID=UPI00331C0CE0